MGHDGEPMRTRAKFLLTLALLGLPLACVIVDPPAELPVVPSRYPVILHSLVVPAANNPLLELPQLFIVPVELNDPNRSFFYSLFVDFESSDLPSIQDQTEVTDKGANIKVLAFPPPRDLTKGCHRIELLVSYTQPVRGAVGSDSITWFYTPPETSLLGCSAFDGGVVPMLPQLLDAGGP